MFLPVTKAELHAFGWNALDVILVTGDSYIDSPNIGAAVIGKSLVAAGYRVGIIAQPDTINSKDITRLGEPLLFWGITGGSVDSMVANYTATKKKRRHDDFTPGGLNTRRPDRAVIVYANLVRRFFKHTVPLVLGGIESSLRRVAHYDYWDDNLRGSILFDAKADYLLYGMAERSVIQLAEALTHNKDPRRIRSLCYAAPEPPADYLQLPSLSFVRTDKHAFVTMFHTFYRNNDPVTAKGLAQQHGSRWLVHNPPAHYETQAELDSIYDLGFEQAQHPYYEKQGSVRALDTIRFSITTHRGCYGECNFCAIAVHEGRTVRWRSQKSIAAEARRLTKLPGFKGIIHDVGGPTANMYGFECDRKRNRGACRKKRCLDPEICPLLHVDHIPQIELLRKLREIPGVRKVFVSSGIRHDLVLGDKVSGVAYLEELVGHHVSGQLKVAPEQVNERILALIGKPDVDSLLEFKKQFERCTRQAGKKQFLTYYFIAAHPGCSEKDMFAVKRFASEKLRIHPEQVQVFTPTPSTYSTLMYVTEMNPFTGEKLFVEKNLAQKTKQKKVVTG
ncbi:MAG TPA: YgiQ family radical SAM protein [Thermodesulfobacteriota bacterium]|nr:YgiQ family radical SAM protein [Thermodesulfobacteriota bacterium]HNU73042.1 YgiQ family radical SAM protein [Thermodesulfobacteriota bacterium]